jgi:hypothetical protein
MKVTVMKMRITGGVLLLGLVTLIWAGGGLESLINLPRLLYVTVLPAGLTLMKHRKGQGKAKVLNDLKRYIVFGGAIGTLAGFAQIALYLDSYHHLFYAIAVILLPAFYALVIYCVIDTFTE